MQMTEYSSILYWNGRMFGVDQFMVGFKKSERLPGFPLEADAMSAFPMSPSGNGRHRVPGRVLLPDGRCGELQENKPILVKRNPVLRMPDDFQVEASAGCRWECLPAAAESEVRIRWTDVRRTRDPALPRSSLSGSPRLCQSDVPFAAMPPLPNWVQEKVVEHTVPPESAWQDLAFGEMIRDMMTPDSPQEIRFAARCNAASKSSRN